MRSLSFSNIDSSPNYRELEGALRLFRDAEAIVAAIADEPDDVLATSGNIRLCLPKTIHLSVGKEVAYQLPALHAEGDKGIAFTNWTHLNGGSQHVGIEVGDVRACLFNATHNLFFN